MELNIEIDDLIGTLCLEDEDDGVQEISEDDKLLMRRCDEIAKGRGRIPEPRNRMLESIEVSFSGPLEERELVIGTGGMKFIYPFEQGIQFQFVNQFTNSWYALDFFFPEFVVKFVKNNKPT